MYDPKILGRRFQTSTASLGIHRLTQNQVPDEQNSDPVGENADDLCLFCDTLPRLSAGGQGVAGDTIFNRSSSERFCPYTWTVIPLDLSKREYSSVMWNEEQALEVCSL